MRTTDGLYTGFRQAEVFDLALLNQRLYGAGDLFDGNVRVDAVLIEQIDPVGLEPLQRSLGHLSDVLRPAVETGLPAPFDPEAELRRDDHPIADRRERFTDDLLVGVWAVDFRGVEEGDAVVNGGPDDRDAFVAADRRSISEADAHAPETERRDFQSVLPEHSLLHCVISFAARSTSCSSQILAVGARRTPGLISRGEARRCGTPRLMPPPSRHDDIPLVHNGYLH
jgi:hypothetical protein